MLGSNKRKRRVGSKKKKKKNRTFYVDSYLFKGSITRWTFLVQNISKTLRRSNSIEFLILVTNFQFIQENIYIKFIRLNSILKELRPKYGSFTQIWAKNHTRVHFWKENLIKISFDKNLIIAIILARIWRKTLPTQAVQSRFNR